MDVTRCITSRDMSHNQPETSGYEHRPFTSGNHGNNTPPRSPRQKISPPPSPPRCPPSHHEAEANEEISSEALMRFEQDEEAQCLMHVLLECNGDRYFQCMTSRVPLGYDVHQIVQERVPNKFEILRYELQ